MCQKWSLIYCLSQSLSTSVEQCWTVLNSVELCNQWMFSLLKHYFDLKFRLIQPFLEWGRKTCFSLFNMKCCQTVIPWVKICLNFFFFEKKWNMPNKTILLKIQKFSRNGKFYSEKKIQCLLLKRKSNKKNCSKKVKRNLFTV